MLCNLIQVFCLPQVNQRLCDACDEFKAGYAVFEQDCMLFLYSIFH